MKKIFSIVVLNILILGGFAQQEVKLKITDGLSNETVKERIEQNVSDLLSEFNRACAQERSLRLDNIDMDLSGKRSLQYLWKNLHFFCLDNTYMEHCLTSAEGYVIRNIYIEVNPMAEGYQDEKERILTIRITKDGQIASVAMASSDMAYEKIVKNGLSVVDMARRRILGAIMMRRISMP